MILSNFNKFKKVSIKIEILNFSIDHDKNINNYLKRIEKSETLSINIMVSVTGIIQVNASIVNK